MRENFMHKDFSARMMNKIMFFMANAGWNEVETMVSKCFVGNLYEVGTEANHIWQKYVDLTETSRTPTTDLYFAVDRDCKRKICDYIFTTYHDESRLKDVYPTSEQRAVELANYIDDNLNVSPRSDTPLVKYCTENGMHRYTQNEFFKLIVKLIKGWANACEKGWWDGRNEFACKLSKKLAEVIDDFILE